MNPTRKKSTTPKAAKLKPTPDRRGDESAELARVIMLGVQ